MIEGLSYNGNSLAYNSKTNKTNEIKSITDKVTQISFSIKLKRHHNDIVRYWELDRSLEICEDDDLLDLMVEIETKLGFNSCPKLGLKFLKEAKCTLNLS